MKVFVRILCVLLAILASAGLFASTAAAVLLSSVRGSLNPAFVERTAENLDFASIRFPDGFGGFTTIPDQLNEALGGYGVSVSAEQFNSLCRDMGIPAVFRDYCLAFRAWLLDDGPVPQVDLQSAAEAAAAGGAMDGLVFVRDPAAFAVAVMASFVNEQALASRLTSLAPAREIFSAGTLALALSVCLTFALLLLIALRLRWLPTLTVGGAVCALSGLAAYLSPMLAAPYKAALLGRTGVALESTFDIVYLPVMGDLSRAGLIVLIAGGAVCLLSAVLWSVMAAVRRRAARRLAEGVPEWAV